MKYILFFAFLFLNTIFNLSAQDGNYTIQILVTEAIVDNPLDHVEVWYNDQLIGETNAMGEYLFNQAKPGGRYTFTIRKAGYEVKSESRFAKEEMNKALTPLAVRKISSLMDTYQELLKNQSPDVKRMESLYRVIIESLDAERNLKVKNEFLAENQRIENENRNPYKVNLAERDQELKPIVKENLNKLSEFKR